jgi:hypothetical protein
MCVMSSYLSIYFHLFCLLHKSLYINGLRGPGRRKCLIINDLRKSCTYSNLFIALYDDGIGHKKAHIVGCCIGQLCESLEY